MGDWTGTVPSFPVGNLRSADMTTLADIDTALVTAWTTWSPTLANLTLGNGTVLAKYRRAGKAVDWRFKFKLGSTSAVGTGPTFTLPFTPSADWSATDNDRVGVGVMFDSSTTIPRQTDPILFTAPTTVLLNHWNATPSSAGTNATTPWTWATSDYISAWGTFYTD